MPRPGVWSGPAFAIGRRLNADADDTKDAVLAAPNWSVTTRRNRSVVPVGVPGAVNVGFCADVLESVTVGGDRVARTLSTCVHAYVIVWPSGSDEPEPSSVTVAFGATPVWFGPALAIGAPFASTAMSTMSAAPAKPNWSVTTSLKCNVTGPVAGAANVGFCAEPLDSVTVGR